MINYMFPTDYLQEKPSGCWVNGVYMALEGKRRTKQAMELESTFWMAKFHSCLKS